jgi:enoyl-CoA hydratase/carnithine racemase
MSLASDTERLWRIELPGPGWPERLTGHACASVTRGLRDVDGREAVSAVLLWAADDAEPGHSSRAGDAADGTAVCAAVMACPVPVVAAVAGGATGWSLLLALTADVLVLSRECEYGFGALGGPDGVPDELLRLITSRLGARLLASDFARGVAWSGADLASARAPFQVVDRSRTPYEALSMAQRLSRFAPLATRLLKQRLRDDPSVRRPGPDSVSRVTLRGPADEAPAIDSAAKTRRVTLRRN